MYVHFRYNDEREVLFYDMEGASYLIKTVETV